MTVTEAIKVIENEKSCVKRRTIEACNGGEYCASCDLLMEDLSITEAYDLANQALEKQVPKKPLNYNIFQRHCECGAILKIYYKHCYDCGQAIDWSGEKGK